ncbi:MAG: C10 family peptidase [Alloprevotella sp.]|nr:C10 family peptidase [Alloprevotella sp.]
MRRYPTLKQLLPLLLLLATAGAWAEPIDETVAARRAASFLSRTNTLKAVGVPRLAHRTDATYLYTAGKGTFVLLAADDRLPEVLAYGEGSADTVPPAMQALLQEYDRRLRFAQPTGKVARTQEEFTPVAPLLTTIRDQYSPYNACCPFILQDDNTYSTERAIVGCVATALEQVLTYYRREYVLQDTLHGWTTDRYEIPDVLPGNSVDTRLIRDNYRGTAYSDTEVDAVARLSYWLGIAAHMNWGLGSSGAVSRRCIEPLRTAFGLGYVFFADSYKYAPAEWPQMLRRELSARRPVYYAGNNMRLSGHAFVLDGYDSAGLFHVNWGYGGSYDGYFDIDVLYTGEPPYDRTDYGAENGFFCNQEAIFIHPDEVADPGHPDTLARTGEEIIAEAWSINAAPMKTAYTPMTLTLRNTADYPLTTPIELFTNLPADTAYLQQGDYVALTSVTLAAGESRTVTVHLRFDEDGERILRLSADDVHYQTLGQVSISPFHSSELAFSEPQLAFPAEDTAEIAIDIAHTAGARAGRIVTYELLPVEGEAADAISHARYLYLEPGEKLHDTVRFRGLNHGTLYELNVRCPWTIQRSLRFRLPSPEGIGRVESAEVQGPWFGLDGRRASGRPDKGIFIRDKKKYLLK